MIFTEESSVMKDLLNDICDNVEKEAIFSSSQ